MDRDESESFTLYVDNLPEDVGIFWFRNFFNKFGVVIDAFIPSKRSKVTNRRFGFVRYNCATSADVAISRANSVWIEDRKLYVKFAAFKDQRKLRFQNKAGQATSFNTTIRYSGVPSKRGEDSFVHHMEKGGPVKHFSFADVVKGSIVSPSKISILAKEESIADNDEWLSRSIIAKLPAPRIVESIKECFISEGVFDVLIRSLGGNFVVLTFSTVSDMKSMIECTIINWLRNFFEEFREWSPDFDLEACRNVWISCYGVPLHLWNPGTFFSIGKIWGDMITLDEATSNKLSFSSGKVLISTKSFGIINQEINLEANGRVYPIRVMEELVVVNNMMREVCGCKCKGRDHSISLGKNEVECFVTREGDNLEEDGVAAENDNIVEMVALREDVENVESSKPYESVHGVDASSVDEDQHSHVPANVLPLEIETDKVSNDINSDDPISIAKISVVGSDIDDSELVSADPLITYVDYMRHKKKHQINKGRRRNPLWSKNPLKAAMFSRSNSRVHKENNSRSLKLGMKKGSNEEPTRKTQEDISRLERGLEVESFASSISGQMQAEVSSVDRNRNLRLIKQARKNMELSALCGVKYFGRESYNIKKYLELEGVEISEQEIKAFEELEEGASISMEF